MASSYYSLGPCKFWYPLKSWSMEEAAAHGEPTLSSKAGSQATLRDGLLTTRQATLSQGGKTSSELGSPLSEGIPGPRTHNSLKNGILAPDKRIRPLRHARVVQTSYMAPLFQTISEAYSPHLVNKHLTSKKYVEARGNCCLQKH